MSRRERALGHYTHEKSSVGCAAALATLDVIEEERLLERAQRLGAHALERLHDMRRRLPWSPTCAGSACCSASSSSTRQGRAGARRGGARALRLPAAGSVVQGRAGQRARARAAARDRRARSRSRSRHRRGCARANGVGRFDEDRSHRRRTRVASAWTRRCATRAAASCC